MSIHARIRHLRKDVLHLTQDEFSKKLKMTRANVASIEKERISVTDRVISDICAAFNVREEWLRTGEGKIERPPISDEFAEFAAHHNLTPAETEVMRYCFFLPPSDRAALFRHITKLADTIRAAEEAEQQNAPTVEPPAASAAIEAKVAAYREQLIAEEKGLSASSSGNRNIEKA